MATRENPFTPASAVEPTVKALLYGGWGSGKTYFGLGAPGKVAVCDTEGGTAFYRNRFDYDVIATKSYREVVGAIEYIEANPKAYKTLVIDPITVIYDTLQEAALKARVARKARNAGAGFDPDNVDLEMLDWGRIKRNYKALMTRLVNLPCHVIVIAREKEDLQVDPRTGESSKRGVKPDAEKSTPYYFDVVIRTTTSGESRIFTVEKDRTGTLPLGSRHTDPTFDTLFTPLLAATPKKKGEHVAQRHVASDEEAAVKDAEAFGEKVASPALVAEFIAALDAAGYDPEEVRLHRNWPPFADMASSVIEEALAKMKAKPAPKPAQEPTE